MRLEQSQPTTSKYNTPLYSPSSIPPHLTSEHVPLEMCSGNDGEWELGRGPLQPTTNIMTYNVAYLYPRLQEWQYQREDTMIRKRPCADHGAHGRLPRDNCLSYELSFHTFVEQRACTLELYACKLQRIIPAQTCGHSSSL